jgi:hypothetical protein
MAQHPPSDPPTPPPVGPPPPPFRPPPLPPGYPETPGTPSSLWRSPTPWAIVATFFIVLFVLSAVGFQTPATSATSPKPSATPSQSPATTSQAAVSPPTIEITPTAVPTPTSAPTSASFSLPTSFDFTSELGDYIGQGMTQHFAPRNDTFTLYAEYGGYASPATTSGFIIYVSAQDSERWNIEVAPPRGQTLHTGTYSVATRAVSRGGNAAGLDVYGDGRGCNMSFGSFTIIQLVANRAGVISAVDVSFTQHCESATSPALTGRIAVRATV